MTNFPALSTGSVVQYPLGQTQSFTTDVIRFLDAADQRCIVRANGLRQWLVRLDLLNEAELATLEQFFAQMQGPTTLFGFIDPITGQTVPNCRFAGGDGVTTYTAENIGASQLIVTETYV
jgi:hypothetical protein